MRSLFTGLITGIATVSIASQAMADSVSDFYAGPGKQIRFVIRTTPGSSYDLLSRQLSRFMPKYIPGNPTMLPINMPGAGGIIAANFMANIAPQDGSVVGIVGQAIPSDQALGLSPGFTGDLTKFNWIADVMTSNQILAVWHSSPTRTLEDAKRRMTTVGTTGASAGSGQYPAFYNNVLGTKFKIITGYAGGPDIDLAMERGELEGRASNQYADYMASNPRFISEKLIRPIIQVGMKKEAALPDVPLLLDLPTTSKDKPLIEFMSRAASVGRPLATTPGVPMERVAALRKAFQDTLKDPAFAAEMKSTGTEINPMPGPELAALIAGIMDIPDDVKQRVKLAIQTKE